MPFDLTAPLPSVVLYYNCTAVFEAVDPTTGDPVSGVTVKNPALYGVNLIAAADSGPDQTIGTELPIFVSLSDDETLA